MSRTEKHLMERLSALLEKQTKAVEKMNTLGAVESHDAQAQSHWMHAQKEVLDVGEEIAATVKQLREVRKGK